MHASSALFDAVVSSERPAREQLTPQTQESKAVSQWKSLFAGHHKRKGRLAPAVETPQPKAKPAEQLYLDFGQRSFGQRQECKTCGLLYTLGQPEDEEMHRRHHRRVVTFQRTTSRSIPIPIRSPCGKRVPSGWPSRGSSRLLLACCPARRMDCRGSRQRQAAATVVDPHQQQTCATLGTIPGRRLCGTSLQ